MAQRIKGRRLAGEVPVKPDEELLKTDLKSVFETMAQPPRKKLELVDRAPAKPKKARAH